MSRGHQKLVTILLVLTAVLLVLLGTALWQWREMAQDLALMNRQLEKAALEQGRLEQRLNQTRQLLQRQMARLKTLEATRQQEKETKAKNR